MSATEAAPRGLGARLARNSFHSASGRVVAILAWLALTPALVRALGPEGFGVWSLFYALAEWNELRARRAPSPRGAAAAVSDISG